MFKKGDILLILFIIFSACLLIICNNYSKGIDSSQKTAVIMHDGKVVKKLELSHLNALEYIRIDDEFKIVILAQKNKIRFLESDCPDKICVKTGWLSTNGDQAICMPSKTMIKIEGKRARTDAILY
jgi:hypothetical protein